MQHVDRWAIGHASNTQPESTKWHLNKEKTGHGTADQCTSSLAVPHEWLPRGPLERSVGMVSALSWKIALRQTPWPLFLYHTDSDTSITKMVVDRKWMIRDIFRSSVIHHTSFPSFLIFNKLKFLLWNHCDHLIICRCSWLSCILIPPVGSVSLLIMSLNWLGCWATLAFELTLTAGALAILLLLWRLWRFTVVPFLQPLEPKEIPYWIPCK